MDHVQRLVFLLEILIQNESTGSFLDIVEISAIDGNNSAVAVANIVTTLAASTSSVIVGNTRKIVGHNSTTESYVYSGGSPYSNLFSGACGSTNVVVTPPSGVPLKSITIKFRPENAGTAAFSCSTCAYVLNSSGGVCTQITNIFQSQILHFHQLQDARYSQLN